MIESPHRMWQRIVAEIPSRHFPPGDMVSQFLTGYRAELADFADTRRQYPLRYLEVGCRLGHSLATVMLASGGFVRATVVDMWIEGYGDEPNPGPTAVLAHLDALGADRQHVEFFVGDSHKIIPGLRGPYDLILVDGDHTAEGAEADIRDCARLLQKDGLMVFDDAVEPLLTVWRNTAADLGLASEEFLGTDFPWCAGWWPEGKGRGR